MAIRRQPSEKTRRKRARGGGRNKQTRRANRSAAAAAAFAAAVLGGLASAASAAQFTQCPAVGNDAGCEYLIAVTDQGPMLQQDSSQPPIGTGARPGDGDVMVGIVNNSSRQVQSIQLSGTNGLLFRFDGDGLCNTGAGPAPAGCQPPPGSSASCNPSTTSTNHCSFAPPPGEPPGYTEPGAANYSEENPANTAVPPPWPNGDLQNGYEGPRNWFSNISADYNTGTVNFSPPLAPGESAYFSVEDPLTSVTAVVNVPTASTSIKTRLVADGLSGTSLFVPEGAAATDTATIGGMGASKAGGTVDYRVYSDKTCRRPIGPPSSAPVTNGTAGPSTPIKLPYGQYYVQASYSGDSANAPSASTCDSESLFFAKRFRSGLPPTRVCLRPKLTFDLRNPRGVNASTARVDVNGKLIRRIRLLKRPARTVLRRLPSGSFHIEVIAIDRRGRIFEDSRLYHRCTRLPGRT